MLTVVDASAPVVSGNDSDIRTETSDGDGALEPGQLAGIETGVPAPHSGRISIVDPSGPSNPSGRSAVRERDVGDPAGPAGIAMRGRTLYVLMSIGDGVLRRLRFRRGTWRTNVCIPHFQLRSWRFISARTWRKPPPDSRCRRRMSRRSPQGASVHLSNGSGDAVDIELVANFPDYISDPCRGFRRSCVAPNPFGLDGRCGPALRDGWRTESGGGRSISRRAVSPRSPPSRQSRTLSPRRSAAQSSRLFRPVSSSRR